VGTPRYGPTTIDDQFATGLNEETWIPAYLPAWSSIREAAATYAVDGEGLHLTIPPDQPLWCPDLHETPLRVSAVQSGNWSGPVGSSRGQQHFREGLVVREEQRPRWGFTPYYGYVEVECRARLSARSMFSAWMVGLEDEPDSCGEITIVEVFGDTLSTGTDGKPLAGLGCGVKALRDPRLQDDFSADLYPIDIGAPHRYAVDWRPGHVDFFVDDVPVRAVQQAPAYPLELIVAVFDFPDRAPAGEREVPVPELVVRRVIGRAASTQTAH
jgi:Glycosyl hydrolases family 16